MRGLVLAALLVSTSAAWGQPEADPVADTDLDRVATETYERGFQALAEGKLAQAIADFQSVIAQARHPEQVAAAKALARLAKQLVRERDLAATTEPTPVPRPLAPDDRPRAGRTELVVASTLAGSYGGIVLLGLADISDFRAGTLVVAGGTAAGFLGSLWATRNRAVTQGAAEAWSTGLGIGLVTGLVIADPLGLADSGSEILTLSFATMALYGTGALFFADATEPTAGQVGLTTTLATMGLATVGLGVAAVSPKSLDEDGAQLAIAGGLNAGVGLGLGLAGDLEWSKSRSRLVNLSTLLGSLAGATGFALVAGEPEGDNQLRLFAGSILAGAWIGLGLGVHLTRDMQPDPRFTTPYSQATTQLSPILLGRSPGVGLSGAF